MLILKAGNQSEIDAAFATLVQQRADGLVVGGENFFITASDQIVALAARHAVPTIYNYRNSTAVGGLISYRANQADGYRLAGVYTGQILKGAKPADLPVQQSTKVRAGHQPQDRQGAWSHRAADAACPRRRGDRMSAGFIVRFC